MRLDNLTKGAAGGAVQWMNRMLGYEETAGLIGAGGRMDLMQHRTPATGWSPRCRADHLAPVYAQWPLDVVDAEGVYLHTRDGRRVLDLYGGHAVAALGYSHPGWLAALASAGEGAASSRATPCRSRCARARRLRLTRFAGLGLNTVFFINTGAEANENALKLAFAITGPPQGRRDRGQLPRPHRGRGRRHLGRGAEVVRLSAGAVRRRVPAARRPAPPSRASSARTPRR